MQLYLRHQPTREAPQDFQRAVADFARANSGQTAEIVWVTDPVNCWQVRLYLRGDDPRRTDDPSTHFEPVLLHEWVDPKLEPHHPHLDRLARGKPGFVAYELEDLGISGLISILEKGSVLSGRGDYKSAEHALHASLKRENERQAKIQADAKDQAVQRTKDIRRRVLKIPFIPVGIEFGADRR